MDGETIAAYGFLLLGLSFFLLIVLVILRDDEKMYHRRLDESREFGYRDKPGKSFINQ